MPIRTTCCPIHGCMANSTSCPWTILSPIIMWWTRYASVWRKESLSATFGSERIIELTHSDDEIWVVYDGECPLCSRYVLLYQLRQRGQRIHLIDARSEHPIIGVIRARNLD